MARVKKHPFLGLCSALLAQALFCAFVAAMGWATSSSPELIVKVLDAETGRFIANRKVDIYLCKKGPRGAEEVDKILAWADTQGTVRKTLPQLADDAEYEAWAVTVDAVSQKKTISTTSPTQLELWIVKE